MAACMLPCSPKLCSNTLQNPTSPLQHYIKNPSGLYSDSFLPAHSLCSSICSSHSPNTHKNFPSKIHRITPRAHAGNPISQFFPHEEENDDFYSDDVIREECGVVGIYGDPEAARLCYLALHALQHRGQEGAGIVTATDGILHTITGVGLVADVFDESKLNKLPGSSAIGHVRLAADAIEESKSNRIPGSLAVKSH